MAKQLEDLPSKSSDDTTKDAKQRSARLKASRLEARILLSATWVDAEVEPEALDDTPPDEALDAEDSHELFGPDEEEAENSIFGSDRNDRIDESLSTDAKTIDAGAGNDVVVGSTSDDTILGGTGNDDLHGNDGNDTFVYTQGDGTDRFRGGDGHDVVDATQADTLSLRYMVASDSIETIQGGEQGLDIQGTGSNDRLDFSATTLQNVQSIDAGAGNDVVVGANSDDTILGGTGNDDLHGNDGNDTFVYAQGDGTDRFRGGDGHDVVDATQADTLSLRYMVASDSIETIQGGEQGLDIQGTGSNDRLDFSATTLQNVQSIDAGAGNDVVVGANSDDTILGGTGNDDLHGNDGNDTFVYAQGDGTDRFRGGDGHDVVDATQADTLSLRYMVASDSIETIQGGEQGLDIQGTGSNDRLDFSATTLQNVQSIDAGAGNDVVVGANSDDTILGGTGNDDLHGNDGNDTFVYTQGDGTDRFRGGDGHDVVDATQADTLSLRYMVASDSIETIQGGEQGLDIQGTGSNDRLDFSATTLQNVQSIDAGAGNDVVVGANSDDTILGGTGNDDLHGNDGNDTFVYAQGDGTDRFRGGDGHDVVDATQADTLSLRYMVASDSIETIQGGEQGLDIQGTGSNDRLDFSATTLQNVQSIDAGAGNDVVVGANSDDTILGGTGNDDLHGNDGNDTFVYTQGDGTDRFRGGDGHDVVDATQADTLSLRYMVASDSIETIQGGEQGLDIQGTGSNDRLDFSATTLQNVQSIDAGAGNDVVVGANSDDTILGGTGNDDLHGNQGNDTFVYAQGDGTDRFRGGDGHDVVDATQADTLSLRYMVASDSIETIQGGEQGLDIQGTGSNDRLDFSATTLQNVQSIDAGAGNDVVVGANSDDTIIGGAGNDVIYGGGGSDTLQLSGNQADYEVIQNSDGSLSISDSRGNDGSDRVYDVEHIQFADGLLSMSSNTEDHTDEPSSDNSDSISSDTPDTDESPDGAENVSEEEEPDTAVPVDDGTDTGATSETDPPAEGDHQQGADDPSEIPPVNDATESPQDDGLTIAEPPNADSDARLAEPTDGPADTSVADIDRDSTQPVAKNVPPMSASAIDSDAINDSQPIDDQDDNVDQQNREVRTLEDIDNDVDRALNIAGGPQPTLPPTAASEIITPVDNQPTDWSTVDYGDVRPLSNDAQHPDGATDREIDDTPPPLESPIHVGDDAESDVAQDSSKLAWIWSWFRAYGGVRQNSQDSNQSSESASHDRKRQ